MKYRTTDEQQRQNNYIVAGFGYCSIQNIERYLSANAYTAGIYGWRADFYEFGALTISQDTYRLITYMTKKRKSKPNISRQKFANLKSN